MTSPLPLLNKLLYTSDMIGGQAVAQAGNLWLLFFLAPPRTEGASDAVPGIALGPFDVDARVFVGALLTAGRFIEALDDPVIGWWSDRTKSRWGRRLPFVVFSTPFYAIFFMLLWHTPAEGASFVNAIWVFVILELFFLSNSMSIGPYESLLPEIAKGHRDRMSIVAWQFYFGVLGAVLGLVVSGVVQDTWGFQVMGVMVGVLGLGFRYLGVAGVWRHAPRDTPPAQMPLKGAFLATLSNTQFLYFLPTFVLYQLSTTMTLGWMPFFVKAILGAENEGICMTSRADGHGPGGDDGGRTSQCGSSAIPRASDGSTRYVCWAPPSFCRSCSLWAFLPGIPILAQGIFDGISGRAAHGRRQPHAAGYHCGHHGLRRDPHRHAPRGDVLREPKPLRESGVLLLRAVPLAHPAAGRDSGRPAWHSPAGAGGGRHRIRGLLGVSRLPAAQHRNAGERARRRGCRGAIPRRLGPSPPRNSSFRRWSSQVSRLPHWVEAKPHWGEIARSSTATYLEASSIRAFKASTDSNSGSLELTMPSTTVTPLGMNRRGSKPPARSVSYSSRKRSTRRPLKAFSAIAS